MTPPATPINLMLDDHVEFVGWITPCEDPIDVNACRAELEALGINVGEWYEPEREFQRCVVSLEALEKLDPLWGRYIWGLEP